MELHYVISKVYLLHYSPSHWSDNRWHRCFVYCNLAYSKIQTLILQTPCTHSACVSRTCEMVSETMKSLEWQNKKLYDSKDSDIWSTKNRYGRFKFRRIWTINFVSWPRKYSNSFHENPRFRMEFLYLIIIIAFSKVTIYDF